MYLQSSSQARIARFGLEMPKGLGDYSSQPPQTTAANFLGLF